jgi:hypothetical protein
VRFNALTHIVQQNIAVMDQYPQHDQDEQDSSRSKSQHHNVMFCGNV